MKIFVKNLGTLEQAEFELGEMTIICGGNNTGKTYATHATFGFLDYLKSNVEFPVEEDIINKLFAEGSVGVSLLPYLEKTQDYLNESAEKYSNSISKMFAGKETLFKTTSFRLELDPQEDLVPSRINARFGSAEKSVLQIHSSEDPTVLDISLIVDKTSDDILPRHIIKGMIGHSIGQAVLNGVIPRPFLASAERTGAAVFQRELDFTKNRLVELLGDKSTRLHPAQLLSKFSGEYPVAVRKNVDFIRSLPDITNRESLILKNNPDILEAFNDIIGGEYKMSKDGEIQFVPSANKRIKLSLVESSSAVRSLLDIGFYLRHVAQPGELLMIDEPELNLHPENQRKVARLFARLINVGVKVFITTHSDYIIKELNTLIMLNRKSKHLDQIRRQYKYKKSELLAPEKVRMYIAEQKKILKKGNKRSSPCQTLTKADIDTFLGIEARSFDATIDEMNQIQEAILFEEEGE